MSQSPLTDVLRQFVFVPVGGSRRDFPAGVVAVHMDAALLALFELRCVADDEAFVLAMPARADYERLVYHTPDQPVLITVVSPFDVHAPSRQALLINGNAGKTVLLTQPLPSGVFYIEQYI